MAPKKEEDSKEAKKPVSRSARAGLQVNLEGGSLGMESENEFWKEGKEVDITM